MSSRRRVPKSTGTKKGLSPEEIKAIVEEDLVKRQFLATANFSPEIYSPTCTFTDEIDSYGYADFVKVMHALQTMVEGGLGTVIQTVSLMPTRIVLDAHNAVVQLVSAGHTGPV